MMIKFFILVLVVIQLSHAKTDYQPPHFPEDFPNQPGLPVVTRCFSDVDVGCPKGQFVYSCINNGMAGFRKKRLSRGGRCVLQNAPETSACNVIVCDGGTLHLTCPAGKALVISSAIYGRSADGSVCPNSNVSNTSCSSATSDETVKTACNEKATCKIEINSEVYGVDPCPGTYKYMNVTYTCE